MVIQELVRNIIETRFEVFNKDVIEQAKNRIIDIIGCAIGGANAHGCSMIKELVKEWGGKEEATILAHGGKVPAYNAAMVNSVMARSYDYGVLIPYIDGLPVTGHISETTVPTAVTMAEWTGVSGKELITALVVGDDITARILKASDYSPAVSWDCTGTVNKFGAAAIAGKLLGLNNYQMQNALGIVLNQLAGSFQNIQDGVHSFKIIQGLSARDGIIAAELACKGWTGIRDPLLSKYGYFALYCRSFNPEILTRDLGREFYADCTFKPYPCCRGIHSAIDCALSLVNEHDIKTGDIESVTINTSASHLNSPLGQPFSIGDFPQGNASFNLRYVVASVLARKSIKLEHFRDEFIMAPEVVGLTKRADVIATMKPGSGESAEVVVKMNDGRELHANVDTAKGNPVKKPLSKEEIEDKFWTNIAFSKTVSDEKAETALALLNNLEEVDNVAEIVRMLATMPNTRM